MANISIEDAQTISVCQFCKESSEIKWKCINCDLLLCKLCNSRIHSNIALLNDHKIINVEDCGSEDDVETSRKVDLTKQPCTTHGNENCILYCKDCDTPMCMDCLIQNHRNHDFCKLDTVYDEKLKIIKDMNYKIITEIPYFKEKEDDLQRMLTVGNKQYKDNRQKIIEIKDKVVKYADDLLSDLDKQWKPTEDQINEELISVRERKDGLEQRKSHLHQTLISQSASGIFVTSNLIDKSWPDEAVRLVEFKERKFFPGKFTNQPISDLFGIVYDVPDLQLLQTYKVKSDLNCVYTCKLIKFNDNSAFIGNCVNGSLQKVTLQNGRITCERELKLPVYDMTLMNNGDLLISLAQHDLKLYTKDGQMKTFMSFAPLKTSSVHMNKLNEIFIGLVESTTEDSVGKVVQINLNGDILHTYEYDKDNKKLFTKPNRICTYKKYVYVIDCWYNLNFSILVLDKEGQHQGIYNGCTDNFTPSDIAVTSTDMVIVTDYINHALHILSPTGELVVCKEVIELGIYQPYSLSICKDDEIWIGTWDSKIHAIKLT